MKIESLRLTVESDELEAALKCIAMPQNVRIRGAHFEPEELVIDLSLLLPLPLYPSVHVSVVQAAGPTAVSYTHLDVYKRQSQKTPLVICAQRPNP